MWLVAWTKVKEFIGGLGLKQWLYISLGVLVIGSYGIVFRKGEQHCQNQVAALVMKGANAEALKQEKNAKDAVENASKAADKLNNLDKSSTEDEGKANAISKVVDRPAACDLTDAERLYLKSLINSANAPE